MKNIISHGNTSGDSFLSLAAKSKSVEMFKAVMVVIVDKLLEEEVSCCTIGQGI